MSVHHQQQRRLPPLASVVVVCRSRDFLAALPHVVECVNAFLDYATPEHWSIERTYARNDMVLLK